MNLPFVSSFLPNAEVYFPLLVENIKDYAIFMLDPDGYIVSWNQGGRCIKGYTHEEIIGQHFSIFYTPEDKNSGKITQELEIAKSKGKYEEESWRVRKDGTLFWASILVTPLYENTGALVGFAKVTKDLTEKKKIEERLSLSEQRFRLLVENIKGYAFFMLDAEGHILSWNQGAMCIKGYTSKEAIGQHFSIFYLPEEQESCKPHWELRVAVREGKYEEESWRVRKNGEIFWARVTIYAIFEEDGTLKGFAKITRDLTERIKAEEKLEDIRKHNTELARNNEDLNELAQIIAHDFKEPLRGISSFSSILIEDLKDRINKQEYLLLEGLKKQAIRMNGLLDSLLKISYTDYSKPELQATDLNRTLKEVLELLNFSLQENKVEIRIPQPLPTLYCDPVRMREVFNNLIINAMKYNDKDEKWIEIGWEDSLDKGKECELVLSEEGKTTIYVKDNGIGISEKDFGTIFKPFKRLHRREAYGNGTGIGLNLARKIVQRHQGSMWVESVLGQGTTFYFSLPSINVNKEN